jgi:hypothetical protein
MGGMDVGSYHEHHDNTAFHPVSKHNLDRVPTCVYKEAACGQAGGQKALSQADNISAIVA